MTEKILLIILKVLLKHRNECIGSFFFKDRKYCLYISEYGMNSELYQKNLKELLNSSVNSERWKKAFIRL